MRRARSTALSRRLALASLGTAVAIGVVCAVGLSSLENASAVARVAVLRQLALSDDAAAMSAFLYQKGFVAEYLLTGNRSRLQELESSRPEFETWLGRAHQNVGTALGGKILNQIQAEYAAFDEVRRQAIALYDAGLVEEAKAKQDDNHARTQVLRNLFVQLSGDARAEAQRTLDASEVAVRRLARVLVATSVAGAVASLFAGFLWARKVTKPIYELEVQVESAAERTRIKVGAGRLGLDALGDQVAAMVEKLEQTDAALAEHRRRLVQSEKLSAVGELAAKLAHEVLNPLAGIKAAVQLLVRRRDAAPESLRLPEVAEAIDREITRVDGLLRRLMGFARPLAPRTQVVTVRSLIDGSLEAARGVLSRRMVSVEVNEAPGLPPLEADPLLLKQAFTNLIVNAADAMSPAGGKVLIEVGRHVVMGRDEIYVSVSDYGSGVPQAALPQLFKPFFTTKPDGHGLGLAVSQNIVLEHGGGITARNRPADDGPGAIFEVSLPVLR
ncbi:MAG: ATP-binding protein, partial [Myxococcales bacterium]